VLVAVETTQRPHRDEADRHGGDGRVRPPPPRQSRPLDGANVGVRIMKVHRWDAATGDWARSRPELDGRLLQPSNQLPSEPELVEVFPSSDRIVDLASVDLARAAKGANPIFVEISHPWPPNEANVLEPATWRLEVSSAATTSSRSGRS
jgi:hypothetical protein